MVRIENYTQAEPDKKQDYVGIGGGSRKGKWSKLRVRAVHLESAVLCDPPPF